MAAPGMATAGSNFARAGNIAALVIAISIILILPFKKEIWYDETVSILCSKGISHESQSLFAQDTTLSSSAIQRLNTSANVFNATVIDNGNSFLYNLILHWFTQICGDSIAAYMLLSKLCAIVCLIAFLSLCKLFLPSGHFVSLAILLLATDLGFLAMSHEIRAYSMGIMFVTLAALYTFRYSFGDAKPVSLFFAALFSVAAILSHYLCIYIVLFFIGVLLIYRRKVLLSVRSIIALIVPVILLVSYICLSYPGISTMNMQNHEIQKKFADSQFSITEVIFRSMKMMAINFKIVFPAFRDNKALFAVSFLSVLLMYVAGIRLATRKTEKRNVRLLFMAGTCSTIFLVLLSLKSHHYTSLYFRYYSFGLPFSTLFVAYVIYLISVRKGLNVSLKGIAILLIIIPSAWLFADTVKHEQPRVQYSHAAAASEILHSNVSKIEIPSWRDAFLIQSLLPPAFKIDYFRNAGAHDFTLYTASGTEKLPVIREDQ